MTTPHYLLANPFAGQNIGHLRMAVVGDSGVGKTMFARQFVDTLPVVLCHDWKDPQNVSGDDNGQNDDQDDEDEDYIRTEALTEKSASTMMEIPWDNMDTDDEVPARNLIFVGEPLTYVARSIS